MAAKGCGAKLSHELRVLAENRNYPAAAHFAVRDDRPKALARIYRDEIGYRFSLKKRMRTEETFGYIKSICGMAAIKVRGVFRVDGKALLALATYNLVRRSGLAAS